MTPSDRMNPVVRYYSTSALLVVYQASATLASSSSSALVLSPMFFSRRLLLLLVAVQAIVTATKYDVMAGYRGSECNEAALYAAYARPNGGCDSGFCYEYETDQRASTECSKENYLQDMRGFFGSSPYIIHEVFSDDDCSTFEFAVGFLATNSCLGGNLTTGLYYKGTVNADGSARVIPYYLSVGSEGSMEGDSSCSSTATLAAVSGDQLSNHTCIQIGDISALYDYFATDSVNLAASYRWYSSNDDASSSSSGSAVRTSDSSSSSAATLNNGNGDTGISKGDIAGISLGAVVIAVVIILVITVGRRRRQAKHASDPSSRSTSAQSRDTASADTAATNGYRGLWEDDIIVAKRVPRDKIIVKNLLKRGAFGEVYAGVFNRQQVAIKMLLPSTRTSLQHVNTFLAEAKITASMDHPHIVRFIAVAWDSLSDLCVALEFMEGGDLRALLSKYEASNHPIGVDRQKTIIALHVCHALAYLHSLSPPMIHRDFKSRNILLNKMRPS